MKGKYAVFCAAMIGVLGLAMEANADGSGYTMSPATEPDERNSFQAPQGAVFVIDNARSTIALCYPGYPDSKDIKVNVICTLPTELPK